MKSKSFMIGWTALSLWGKDDGWIPHEKGKALASLISGHPLISISEGGHLVQEDRPEVLVAEVLKNLG